MKRTLVLLALLASCATGLGYGTTAATGPTAPAPVEQLDTADRIEPTGRAYLTPASTAVLPSSAPATPLAVVAP